MKKGSRLVLIAVAALTMSVAMPSVAFAGEPGGDSGSGVVTVTQEVEIKAEYLNGLSSATATNFATGETMTPFAIPPQGGCSWATVSGAITA